MTIKPGRSAHVRASFTAPRAAGTSFHDIVIGNGAATTTIPIAVRVPVKLTNGHGTFSGTIRGSTGQYSGGEFYFYDVRVPAGTRSIAASLAWPDTGNLVNLFLIDPNGSAARRQGRRSRLVCRLLVGHGARRSLQPHRRAGDLGRAPAGHVAGARVGRGLQRRLVRRALPRRRSPSTRPSSRRPPGRPRPRPATQASADFTVTNAGATALSAYAESQATIAGKPQYHGRRRSIHRPARSRRRPTASRPSSPSPCRRTSPWSPPTATWTGSGTLVDMGLYDPSADRQGRQPRPGEPGQRNEIVRGQPDGRTVDPHPGLRQPGPAAGRRCLHGHRRLRGAGADRRVRGVGPRRRAARGRARRQRHDPR